MKHWVLSVCLNAVCLAGVTWPAEPPSQFAVSEEDQRLLKSDVGLLRQELESLDSEQPNRTMRADIEIGIDAVDRSLEHGELDQKDSLTQARAVIGLARQRLDAARQPIPIPAGIVQVLGYRSNIDGTAQPYAVGLPANYTEKDSRRYPVYVVLHGRSDIQSELPFIVRHHGQKVPLDQSWIQLDVFGRGNNGYRYAGEVDVQEALSDVIHRFRVDEERIVLWGFSMGGAGAWHLGLHNPTRWCAVGAGAGFVDFYKYQMVSDPLPWFQDLTLRIYDSTNYAMNLANVPFITYGGENDGQLLASTTMRDLAAPLNVPLEVLIGPKMGHKFDDASKATFMEFLAKHAEAGRRRTVDRRKTRFITFTVRYHECDWMRIEEQEIPLEASVVDSDVAADGTLMIKTENVGALSVSRSIADLLSIDDGPPCELSQAADGLMPDVYFVREGEDEWRMLDYDQTQEFLSLKAPRKRRGVQGPIDDAFTDSFLCVRGTGTAWSKSHQEYVDWSLARFQREFSKWMRGRVRVIRDVELTEEQVASHHLILFGDPGANSVIADVVESLPMEWTQTEISFGGTSYHPDLHCVPLIYPNPKNLNRYVVLNSGHTFHERDFRASNARLYPRMGDAGVIRFRKQAGDEYHEEIDTGEIFGTSWEFEE